MTLNMELFERVWSEKLDQIDLLQFRSTQYPVRRMCIQRGRLTSTRRARDGGQNNGISDGDVYDAASLKKMNFQASKPLLRAIRVGNEDDVWLLLTRSDVEQFSVNDEQGQSSLSRAVMDGHEGVVRILLSRIKNSLDLEARDASGAMLLMRAVESGNVAMVKLLLDKGANIDATDGDGGSLIFRAVSGRSEALVGFLLDKGADGDAKDRYGVTLLSQAVRAGNGALMAMILDKGAYMEARNTLDKDTPLLLAVKEMKKGLVEMLLDRGANMEARDGYGQMTSLGHAAAIGNEDMARLLLDRGAEDTSNDKFNLVKWMQSLISPVP